MAQDVNDGEAGQGGTTEGPSPSERESGLQAAVEANRKRAQAAEQKAQTLEVKLAGLEGKVDGLAQAKPQRDYTRAELQSQVDDGRMTPDESDRILTAQMEKNIEARVSKKFETSQQETSTATRIQAEVDKYTGFRPDVLVEGTDDRRLVSEEFSRQIALGKPNNLMTELDAMAAVFGPSTRLQSAQAKTQQTHQDVGSDGGDETESNDAPKLRKDVKDHYQKMIDSGMYKGWDDPNLKSEIEGYGARWK